MDILHFAAFAISGVIVTWFIYKPMKPIVGALAIVLYLLGGWVSAVIVANEIPTAELGAILIMNFCHLFIVFINWVASQTPIQPLDREQVHEHTD